MRSHRVVIFALVAAVVGCQARPPVVPLPPMAVMQSRTDDAAVARDYPSPERQTHAALSVVSARHPGPACGTRVNALVLSGGAQYSAYAAGVINGWRATGQAPEFDVICGISSGSLLASIAFAGPRQAELMKYVFTELAQDDLFRYQPLRQFRRNQSIATAEPITRLIDEYVNTTFLDDVRRAHAAGRRCFIGTTNENTRRLVVWDFGAIASSDRPDRDDVCRKLLVASASIPGLVPTVALDVVVDGVAYQERHVDGGSSAESFLRLSEHAPRPDPANPAKPWLTGSNLYIIAGGKLYVDPFELKPTFQERTVGTISSTLHALHRADVWRMYAFCVASGMAFNQTYIPVESDIPSSSTSFEPEAMQRLYAEGYADAQRGIRWRTSPPGVQPEEAELPRAGFVFTTDAVRR